MMLYLFLAIIAVAVLAYIFRADLKAPALALEARLVSDWRTSYKWASMQLAFVLALVTGCLSEFPGALVYAAQAWAALPPTVQTILGPVGAALLLVTIALARLWQQKHPNGQ